MTSKILHDDFKTTHLYKKHIFTLTTLHNHIHQFQSCSTSFQLEYDHNFDMSWQLKTLSEAMTEEIFFFLASSPKSVIINARDCLCTWTELTLETQQSSVLLTAH